MNKVIVHKADQLLTDKPVESFTVEISKKLPGFTSIDDARALFSDDAEKIFSALKSSVPQSTRHYLAQLLLGDFENLYRGL